MAACFTNQVRLEVNPGSRVVEPRIEFLELKRVKKVQQLVVHHSFV